MTRSRTGTSSAPARAVSVRARGRTPTPLDSPKSHSRQPRPLRQGCLGQPPVQPQPGDVPRDAVLLKHGSSLLDALSIVPSRCDKMSLPIRAHEPPCGRVTSRTRTSIFDASSRDSRLFKRLRATLLGVVGRWPDRTLADVVVRRTRGRGRCRDRWRPGGSRISRPVVRRRRSRGLGWPSRLISMGTAEPL